MSTKQALQWTALEIGRRRFLAGLAIGAFAATVRVMGLPEAVYASCPCSFPGIGRCPAGNCSGKYCTSDSNYSCACYTGFCSSGYCCWTCGSYDCCDCYCVCGYECGFFCGCSGPAGG